MPGFARSSLTDVRHPFRTRPRREEKRWTALSGTAVRFCETVSLVKRDGEVGQKAMGRKRKVFISFDYDHDRRYRYLLSALSANPNSDVEFSDSTPGEINTSDVGRVKAVLTERIRAAAVTLVVVGAHANSYHPDRKEIGFRNWQWWEVERSCAEGNSLVGVKIDQSYAAPEPMLGRGAVWVKSFKPEDIARAIREA